MSKHSTIEYRCSECGELVQSEGLGTDEVMACAAHPRARIDSCPVEINIEITDVDGCDLYLKYDGQTNPQPCYLELDCEKRTLEAEANPEIGNAVPERVWHGHVQRFGIPALRANAANELMREIAPLAARVCDGYRSHWNGSNHVARFDDDATAALEEIREACERQWGEDDMLHVWDAEDWFGCQSDDLNIRELGMTASTSDEELEAIAEKQTDEALSMAECDGIEGMDQYLERLRTKLREAADGRPYELTADQGASSKTITAADDDEAREELRDWLRGGDYGELTRTIWIDGYMQREGSDERELVTVRIDPDEPACEGDHEHDWRDIDTQGHGGGVIFRERCQHCGIIRVTDTWAQRPDTGEQGLTSVRYEREDDDDE